MEIARVPSFLLGRKIYPAAAPTITEITTEKGKTNLVVNGYKFHFGKMLKSGEIRWRCNNIKCKSFLRTLGESPRSININFINLNHSHYPLTTRFSQKQLFLSSVKRKAVEEPCETLTDIINLCLENHNMQIQDINVKNTRNAINRARRIVLSSPPEKLHQTHETVGSLNEMTVRPSTSTLYWRPW